jgi:hypothetical protein
VLRETSATLTRLFDVTPTKDWANCEARADVKVDGRVLVPDVPVAYLLFLEKQRSIRPRSRSTTRTCRWGTGPP